MRLDHAHRTRRHFIVSLPNSILHSVQGLSYFDAYTLTDPRTVPYTMHQVRQKSYLLCKGKAPASLHRLTDRRAFSSRICVGINQPTNIINTTPAQATASLGKDRPIKEASAEKPHGTHPAVPYLPRPLGIDDQRVALGLKALNQDVPRDSAEAEKLRKKRYQRAVTKTYWTDYHKLRKTGGKSWTAPPTLIREDMALYFPGMDCIRLSDSKALHSGSFWRNKITLVSILNTQISLVSSSRWVPPK